MDSQDIKAFLASLPAARFQMLGIPNPCSHVGVEWKRRKKYKDANGGTVREFEHEGAFIQLVELNNTLTVRAIPGGGIGSPAPKKPLKPKAVSTPTNKVSVKCISGHSSIRFELELGNNKILVIEPNRKGKGLCCAFTDKPGDDTGMHPITQTDLDYIKQNLGKPHFFDYTPIWYCNGNCEDETWAKIKFPDGTVFEEGTGSGIFLSLLLDGVIGLDMTVQKPIPPASQFNNLDFWENFCKRIIPTNP
jgi:hypothetical protein